MKKKVLILDIDPQSNLSQSLGIMNPENNICGALRGRYEIKPIEIMKGFHIIPSVSELAQAEMELNTETDREYFLKEIIDKIKHSYDYVLIDCPPSLGLLTSNALTASDQVLVPLQAEYLATQGLSKLLETVQKMKKRLNPGLYIGGIFLTQYDERRKLNKKVLETVQTHFGTEIFQTKIRKNTSLAEAPAYGLDIFRYNATCNGAIDYTSLAKEILIKNKN
jgi:chromosome partitioning protein